MSDIQTVPVADLEELFDNEIPCGGYQVHESGPEVSCDRPAALHSKGHGCKPGVPQKFKCIACWQAWYVGMIQSMQRRGGFLRCHGCTGTFYSVSDFSDYRPI